MASAGSSPKISQHNALQKLWHHWLARRRRNQARSLSYGRFRLTREGLHFLGVLLFIFVGAVIREINLLILLAGSMIGLLILQWRFSSRTLIGLSLERKLPASFSVGQIADIALQISNPKQWLGAWLVVTEDKLRKVEPENSRMAEKGIAVFDEVRPRGISASRYQLEFHQRGRYRIGPSVISTRFPIGLGRGWRTLDNACEIIVHPQLGELTARVKSLFQLRLEGHATTSPKAGVHEAEFYGLRPWQSGDSKRWIHWRTTARLGDLAVRQFERQQQRQICILLDLCESPGHDALEAAVCERAISFLASLVVATAKQGTDKLAVAIAGAEIVSLVNMQSAVMARQALDALATAKPAVQPDLLGAFKTLTRPLVSNPILLVVSNRESQVKQMRSDTTDSLGAKLLSKLHIKWLDVSAGDLDLYFTMDKAIISS